MKRLNWLMSLLVLMSIVLSACAPAAAPAPAATPPPVAAEPTVIPADEAKPAPTEEVSTAPVTATEAELDAAFSGFLSSMVAYNTIGLDALNTAMAEKPPFLLDVREVAEAEKGGHIEGAVLIPLRQLGENLDKLPSFDTPIVSYCGSGWRCTIAITALGAMGWQDVKALKGGSYGGWVEAGYPTVAGVPADAPALSAAAPDAALATTFSQMFAAIPEGWGGVAIDALNTELVEKPELLLIDVRKADEVEKGGKIDYPNQINIPLEDLIANKAEWPAKDAKVVVYCGSGHRSTIAATILWTYGYSDVRSMKGGFAEWTKAGYAAVGVPEKAPDLDAAFGNFLANMVAYNTMSLDDLNLALASEKPPFLLDVREISEVEKAGHIEGAIVIPLRELADNLDKLPAFDHPIVSYCGSGWRCTIALTALSAMGWQDVKGLKGNSFGGWVEAGYPIVAGLPAEAAVLNAAAPDAALVKIFDDMLTTTLPEGWGIMTADNLNTLLIEKPEVILIDVRTQDEIDEQGTIDAANVVILPLQKFIEEKAKWPAADAKIVVYCGSGHRSTIAATILWTYGYKDVTSLKGGFAAWKDAGYPIVAP